MLPRLYIIANYSSETLEEDSLDSWLKYLGRLCSYPEPAFLLQLRAKRITLLERIELYRQALDLAEEYQFPRNYIYLNSEQPTLFEGCAHHLSQKQLELGLAHRTHSPFAISTHDQLSLTDAQTTEASFLVYSPVFKPSTKQVEGQGLEALRSACKHSSKPIFALGGISPARAQLCRQAGAYGAAVLSGVSRAKDTHQAIEEYQFSVNSGDQNVRQHTW